MAIAKKSKRSLLPRRTIKPVVLSCSFPHPGIQARGLDIEQFKWLDFGYQIKHDCLPSSVDATTPPSPISILPPELLEEIFLTIIWTSSNEPTGYFKPLTLVCRNWSAIARRLELVVLNISGGAVLIDKAIERVQSLRSREGCASTQSLILHGPYNNKKELHRLGDLVELCGQTARQVIIYGYWPEGRWIGDEEPAAKGVGRFECVQYMSLKTMPHRDIAAILGLCNMEKLEYLDLFTHHRTPTLLDWLKGITLPRLHTLRVGDISRTVTDKDETTKSVWFFGSLPALVTLQITITSRLTEAFAAVIQKQVPTTLLSLELWICGYAISERPTLHHLEEALDQRAWSSCAVWMFTLEGCRVLKRRRS